jgi:hypothetical protein
LPILIISNLILTLSCGQDKTNEANIVLNYDTARIAILNYPRSKLWIAKNSTPLTLTQPDIYTIDSLLIQCIAAFHKSQTDHMNQLAKESRQWKLILINLKEYKRQYIPYVDNNRQKTVWVNCFCSDNVHWKNWDKYVVPVGDGGKCFFNVKINLLTKEYYDLWVNSYW